MGVQANCFECATGKMTLLGLTADMRHIIYWCPDCKTLFIIHFSIDGEKETLHTRTFKEIMKAKEEMLKHVTT